MKPGGNTIRFLCLVNEIRYRILKPAILFGHIFFLRLHREALKQSATDPLSGKIDIGILTTGLSTTARKRKVELVKALKDLIAAKGKVPTLNYQKLHMEIKESSQIVSIFHSN